MADTLTMAQLQDYTVNTHGIITSPGKFESEHVDVLYWYDALMNGDGDGDPEQDDIWTMAILDTDRAVCLSIPPAATVAQLWESDSGFVHLSYR